MYKWTVYYQDFNWWGEMLTEDRIYKTNGYPTIDDLTEAIDVGDYEYDKRELLTGAV